jgi:hypothetical protein
MAEDDFSRGRTSTVNERFTVRTGIGFFVVFDFACARRLGPAASHVLRLDAGGRDCGARTECGCADDGPRTECGCADDGGMVDANWWPGIREVNREFLNTKHLLARCQH